MRKLNFKLKLSLKLLTMGLFIATIISCDQGTKNNEINQIPIPSVQRMLPCRHGIYDRGPCPSSGKCKFPGRGRGLSGQRPATRL